MSWLVVEPVSMRQSFWTVVPGDGGNAKNDEVLTKKKWLEQGDGKAGDSRLFVVTSVNREISKEW